MIFFICFLLIKKISLPLFFIINLTRCFWNYETLILFSAVLDAAVVMLNC
jgi:hypothetical protein